jgi:DNA topoisomerase-1
MPQSLLIVESPTKARTIKKYLGPEFAVEASGGHVVDLPQKELGVDINKNFQPTYKVLPRKEKAVRELKKAAEKVNQVYLAPDPDREGEAIAWHIATLLRQKKPDQKILRVLINEITKPAVKDAIQNAGQLDKDRFEAQQARRILDRLVGYQISPLLWQKVQKGLSAGRVQSVAVRLVCEREREIQAFEPKEYWTIEAELEAKDPPVFRARLVQMDDKKVEAGPVQETQKKTYLPDKTAAEAVIQAVKNENFVISKTTRREQKRNPPPPFITASLQQEAARRFNFTAKKTMLIAQGLYEGVNLEPEGSVGLITYMRTDSTRVNQQAINAVRNHIEKNFGKKYLPDKPNIFKAKKSAQEAHEAIRPTSLEYSPEQVNPYLDKDQQKLYELIYKRFVASQMTPAVMDITSVDIPVRNFLFRATGSVIKFQGFMAVYEEQSEQKKETTRLPPLHQGQELKLIRLLPEQHFTQPPPRFNESSLIKELEDKGIGRPSTYAQILSTVQARKYVFKEKRNFKPTELGFLVNDMLVQSFPDLLNPKFTARMEESLDQIEEGKLNWVKLLKYFYAIFSKELEKAPEVIQQVKTEIPTDLKCPDCGRELVIKRGRHGEFIACSGYPECKYSSEFERDEEGNIIPSSREQAETGITCEVCGKPMVIRKSRQGEFLGCSGYPKCKNTSEFKRDEQGNIIPVSRQENVTEITCEICGKPMVIRKGRRGEFLGCSGYPECRNTKNFRRSEDGKIEIVEKKIPAKQQICDKCGKPMVVKSGKYGPFLACSGYPECKNIVPLKQKRGSKKKSSE